MSDMTSANLLIGLPSTGKSTFLAAMWYLAERQDVETSLRVQRLGEDDEHLDELSGLWLSFKEVERSTKGSQPVVSMALEDPETGRTVSLQFPDLAGETFERQWIDRECSASYAELASSTSGVLVFLHPDTLSLPERLEDYPELGAPDDEGIEARKPENDPTATILVELLQFLLSDPINVRQMRVAVVISAWDLVQDAEPKIMPRQWIARRVPLLEQFLVSNRESLCFEAFGVSAQGGDYTNADELARLRDLDPSQRVRMVSHDYSGVDLTRIIKWLMGE